MTTLTLARARPDRQPLDRRRAAIAVGVLYITGTAAGILSVVATGGGRIEGPDHVADAASLGRGLPTGAVLTLVMGLALAFIPLVLFPILRETSRRLALGYVAFRTALETIGYIVNAIAWLALFQLGRDYDAGAADATGLRGAGAALAGMADASGSVVTIFFLVGAAMFLWVLYRSELVPRWLSVWGLLAIVPYLLAALLAMYGVISSFGTALVVLDMPMAIQEMVLAVWLIAKGFSDPLPAAAGHD